MKTDLKKLQNNYYEATVVNATQANEAIKNAQGWLLTLATAELAFTETLILSSSFEIIGTDTYFFEIKIDKKNISFGKHVKL